MPSLVIFRQSDCKLIRVANVVRSREANSSYVVAIFHQRQQTISPIRKRTDRAVVEAKQEKPTLVSSKAHVEGI